MFEGFQRDYPIWEKFQRQLQSNFSKAISHVNEDQLNKFDRELDRLQILLINKVPNSPDYEKLADKISSVQHERGLTEESIGKQMDNAQKHVDLQNFISKNSKQLNEFDEHLVRQLIEKITIHETYCIVEFKNGDSVKINL